MLNITDEIKQLYNTDSVDKTLFLEFYKNRTSNTPILTLSNKDIISESMVLNESVCDSENLEFGSVFASKFEIDLLNINYDLLGLYLKVYIVISDTEYKMPLFNGKVENSELQSNRRMRHIVAYDDVYNILDTDVTKWYVSLANGYSTQSYTIKNFRKKLLDYLGLQYEDKNLINDDFLMFIQTDKTGITARKLLHDICEVNGCFGRLNRNNVFIFKEIKSLSYHYPDASLYHSQTLYPGVVIGTDTIYSINEYINIDYGEYRTKPITKVEIYDSTIDNEVKLVGEFDSWYNYPTPFSNPTLFPSSSLYPGYTSVLNVYTIKDNICIDPGEFTNLMAQQIFNAIYGYTYIPIDLRLRGLPYLEVGDVININLPNTGASITTIILSRNLTGIQALRDEFVSKGDEYHNEEYRI